MAQRLRIDYPIWVGVAALGLFAPFAFLGFEIHHDGLMLKTAMDVARGLAVHRDTFNQYGPLTAWTQGGALWLFGPQLLVLKLLNALFYAAALGTFASVWRRFLPRTFVWCSAAMWVSFAYFFHPGWTMLIWSSGIALFLQSLSALSLVKAFERLEAGQPAGVSFFFSALAGAGVFWARQAVGVPHALGLLIGGIGGAYAGKPVRSIQHREWWIGLLAGYAVGLGGVFLNFALRGSLGAWWEQTVQLPGYWAAGLGDVWPGLPRALLTNAYGGCGMLALLAVAAVVARRPGVRGWVVFTAAALAFGAAALVLPGFLSELPSGGKFLVPIAVLATLGHLVFCRKEPSERAVWVCGWFALASWAQYYPVTEMRHVFWAVLPGIGVMAYGYRSLFPARFHWVALAMLLLVFVPMDTRLFRALRAQNKSQRVRYERPSPLQGMWMKPEEKIHLEAFQDALDAALANHPDAPILNEGPDGGYGVFARNLKNPSALFVRFPAPAVKRELETQRRLKFLRTERPILLIGTEYGELIPKFGPMNSFGPAGVEAIALQELKYREVARFERVRVLAP